MPRSLPEPPRRAETISRATTLLITNTTKLAGTAVGVNELLIRAETTTARIALAALMMTGAQASERVLLAIVDRIFGKGS